jgi:DNA invertase Pin-like site-specific DNA recombinase
MVYCPYCNRWFKNKQALRAHLKHCPLKNSKTNEKLLLDILELRIKGIESKKEIAKILGIDPQTVDDVYNWGLKHYKGVIKIVYRAVNQ